MTLDPAQDRPGPAADFATQDAAYVSPTYLRTPFRQYLLQTDQGMYWLRAPAGLGKSLFVRGVIARRPGRDPAVLEGIDSGVHSDVCSFGVHLAPGATAGEALAALDAAFAGEFGVAVADPVAAPTADDLVARLEGWHAHAVGTGARRLLVCIDGVEKLAPGVAAALIPPVSRLPPGAILLLTSRPLAEGPSDLAGVPVDGATVRDLSYDDAAYKDMLRRYYKDRTRPLLRQHCVAHLGNLLETKAAFERGGRDNRMTDDPTLRDALKGDWKKLTNKFPRFSTLPLPIAPLVPLLDQYDQMWADMIDRAEQRFDRLSAMLDALVAEKLKVEEVAALPKGEALATHLEQLAPVA